MSYSELTAVSDSIKDSSRLGTAWGFAVMITGMLAIMAPFHSGIATTLALAILVTGAGMMLTAYAFKAEAFGKGLLQFLFGGITIICGMFMFLTPEVSMLTLTGVLLVYFLVDGIFAIISGFRVKPVKGWGWMVFSGIASIALAFLLWKEWPGSGQYAVGVLVGIRLIFAGWSIAFLGMAGDSIGDEIEEVGEELEKVSA